MGRGLAFWLSSVFVLWGMVAVASQESGVILDYQFRNSTMQTRVRIFSDGLVEHREDLGQGTTVVPEAFLPSERLGQLKGWIESARNAPVTSRTESATSGTRCGTLLVFDQKGRATLIDAAEKKGAGETFRDDGVQLRTNSAPAASSIRELVRPYLEHHLVWPEDSLGNIARSE